MEQVKGSDEASTGTRFLHEHNIAYNETDASYYQAKVEAIESGETVWMRRNFESDSGIVVDLWTQGKPTVCIDYFEGIADVYVLDEAPDVDPTWTLVGRHEDLGQAVTDAEARTISS